MRRIWVIAFREFTATVKTKAFLIGLFMMPLFMCGGAIMSIITDKLDDRGTKTVAVIDRTPDARVALLLQAALAQRNARQAVDVAGNQKTPQFRLEIIPPSEETPKAIDDQRVQLSTRVRNQEIIGFLEIGSRANRQHSSVLAILDIFRKSPAETTDGTETDDDATLCRFQTRPTNAGAVDFYRWSLMQLTMITRFGLSTVDEATQEKIFSQKPPVVMLGLTTRDPKSGAIVDDKGNTETMAKLGVGLGMMMLMFMMVMVGATPLLQSVLEEKMQKISEVLLGSVQPFQLMMGKLLGMIGVALLLSAVYVSGALAGVYYLGFGEYVPIRLVAWFVFYLVLAVVMYGSLFSAIGASCSDMKEPQALMLPVMTPIVIPLMMIGLIIRNPDGVVAKVVSFFPPTTPMMMLMRQAMDSNIGWWEPLLGGVGVALFTLLCVWAAGRVFRIGILMQGKAPSLKQLIQWAYRG